MNEWLDRIMAKIEDGTFRFAEAFPGASDEKKARFAQLEGWEYAYDPRDVRFGDYLERLEPSAFWQKTVKTAPQPPVVAIWPIQNATSQHLDDQMLTLLSSIETALINTGAVRVVDRASEKYASITAAQLLCDLIHLRGRFHHLRQ